MEVIKAIEEFKLHLLPSEWYEYVWSSDFVGEKVMPQIYALQFENIDFSTLLNNLTIAIYAWDKDKSIDMLRRSNDPFKKSWLTLVNNNVNFRALVSLTSTFIYKEMDDKERRRLAFAASKAYFAFLSIPGSMAYNIFNPLLYDQFLDIYFIVISLLPKNNQNKLKGRKKRFERNDALEDNSNNSTDKLSVEEQQEILQEISNMLDDFSICLNIIRFEDEEEAILQTTKLLAKFTLLEYSTPKSITMDGIVSKSYNTLEKMCIPQHGELHAVIKFILRAYLHHLVINEENFKLAGNSFVTSNDSVLCFIKRLIDIYNKDALVGVIALLQQLCIRMPDKADIRARSIPQIIYLLKQFPYDELETFMQWVVSLAHSESAKYRICAIELVHELINVSEIHESCSTSDGETTDQSNILNITMNYGEESTENHNQVRLLYKFLLGAVLSRTLDVSPILRSKCLNILASLVLSKHDDIKNIMHELFVTPYKEFIQPETDNTENYFNYQAYFGTHITKIPLPENVLPSGLCIMKNIARLTKDRKVFVRKNALQFMANVFLLNQQWISEKRLEILVASSRDVSLMIRKMIVKCLTDLLLLYPTNKILVQSWVQGVVPLIADSDLKCQEKVIEYVKNVIIENLATYDKTNTPHTKLPWLAISTIALADKRPLLKFACRTWSINKSIPEKIYKCLMSHIGTENNFAAWFFIVCISEFEDFSSPRLFVDYFFENVLNRQPGETLSQLVVEAIFLNWTGFDRTTKDEVYKKMKKTIESYSVPLFLISRFMDICYLANKNETKVWSGRIVQSCETFLKKYIAPGCKNHISEEAISCCIHTLGDAAHFHPGVSIDIINCLANIIDPTFTVSNPEIQGINERWDGSVSDIVKAVAVVGLGKVCLQDHFIAKQYATVFATVLLNEDTKPALKINSMAALSDLCVRFTSVVEDKLGNMCVMLKDNNILVRTQCLKFIIQLIQEDYLKPKGALFYYLLITLRDPSNSVRQIVQYFFTNSLLKRNQGIMCHYFIQAIFFFNDYEGSGSFNKRRLSAKERSVFSMAGARNYYDRGQIYKYMLRNMRDDHRFKLSNRICIDILDEVNKGKLSLDAKGVAILKDAFFALACDEMRLENLRKTDDDDSLDKETDEVVDIRGDEAVLGLAKKVFISRIVKVNYVDTIVPTMTKLRHLLTQMKSPLVRDLMSCLRHLMKDFKTEINDILHADPELAAEILLDMKETGEEDDSSSSDDFTDFNMREVRAQCEHLSDKALIEKVGIVTPLKSPSFLRASSSLATQFQLSSSIQCQLPIDGSNILSSQFSNEDSSSEILQSDSQSLSPAYSSGGDSPYNSPSTSATSRKRSSDESLSSSPEPEGVSDPAHKKNSQGKGLFKRKK